MIAQGSPLWEYLSPTQQALAQDGAFLVLDSNRHSDYKPTDYSYLVFPYAKLYEGFLKQLFLDLDIINKNDYMSDRFRIGKVMSPNLMNRLGRRSAYGQLAQRFGESLALGIWRAWIQGRNLVFHYFPHNYRALSRADATKVIDMLVEAMEMAVGETGVAPRRSDV